jgi:uncharacterized protein YcfL
MESKMKKVILSFFLVLSSLVFVGCGSSGSDSKETTYYTESGGVSASAYSLMNSHTGASAQQMLAYCHQYPITGDPYKGADTGLSRSQLENKIDDVIAQSGGSIAGFSKTQFLHMLDQTGGVFQVFITVGGDYIYYYVEEE